MKDLDQIAWQKEVILEEYFDSLEDKREMDLDVDEDYIEELMLKRNRYQ